MNEIAIIDHFKLYSIPAGRQLAALRQCLDRARETAGASGLAAFLESAIPADEALFDQEMRWRARRTHGVQHGEKAVELDRKIDRLLGGIHDALSSLQRFSDLDPERAEAARLMNRELFPDGLGSVTRLNFADQSNAVFRILDRIDDDPAYQELAREAGFFAGLETLRALNEEYAREVSAHRPLSLEELQRERRESAQRLGSVMARILGLFPDENPEHRAARARLMEPILAQNELIRQLKRRHGRKADGPAEDVDFDIDPNVQAA